MDYPIHDGGLAGGPGGLGALGVHAGRPHEHLPLHRPAQHRGHLPRLQQEDLQRSPLRAQENPEEAHIYEQNHTIFSNLHQMKVLKIM